MGTAYSGSPYTTDSLADGYRPAYLDGNEKSDEFPIYDKDDSDKDGDKTEIIGYYDNDNLGLITWSEIAPNNASNPLPGADLLVPGDIFYYNGYHVGMIGCITAGKDPDKLSMEDLFCLESTHFNAAVEEEEYAFIGMVMKNQTMKNYTNRLWSIGRIILP